MFPDHVDAAGCPQSGWLQPSNVTLKAYGGSAIPHLGICTIACLENGKRCEADFFVTNTPGLALFGMPLIRGLGLLNVQIDATTSHNGSGSPIDKAAVLREFPECFHGIGQLEGTYPITLDPRVTPVINSPRRVPIALKEEIKEELTSMEQQGIIQKVTEGQPTDWVNSLVYQRKSNGKLRIGLDPCDLNTAIK